MRRKNIEQPHVINEFLIQKNITELPHSYSAKRVQILD